jgi:hypothetical protein
VTTPLVNLWYSWAKYYSDTKANTGQQIKGKTNPSLPAPQTGNILVLDTLPTGSGLAPGMVVSGLGISTTAGQPTEIVSIDADGKTLHLSQAVTANSDTYVFQKLDWTQIGGATNPGIGQPQTFAIDPSNPPLGVPDPLKFAEYVYVVMKAMSTVPTKPDDKHPVSVQVLLNSIGGNVAKLPNIAFVDNGLPPPPVFQAITTDFRDRIKSILRGVNDYRVQTDQSLWYPDPSAGVGNPNFNAYNLDPFVWFVHKKLGLSGYGFSLDDDVADVGADWGTKLAVSIGGLTERRASSVKVSEP